MKRRYLGGTGMSVSDTALGTMMLGASGAMRGERAVPACFVSSRIVSAPASRRAQSYRPPAIPTEAFDATCARPAPPAGSTQRSAMERRECAPRSFRAASLPSEIARTAPQVDRRSFHESRAQALLQRFGLKQQPRSRLRSRRSSRLDVLPPPAITPDVQIRSKI